MNERCNDSEMETTANTKLSRSYSCAGCCKSFKSITRLEALFRHKPVCVLNCDGIILQCVSTVQFDQTLVVPSSSDRSYSAAVSQVPLKMIYKLVAIIITARIVDYPTFRSRRASVVTTTITTDDSGLLGYYTISTRIIINPREY